MTVLLVLATFIVFLTIDWFYSRKRAPAPVLQFANAHAAGPRPDVVGGFRMPEALRYHFGHTWASAEGPQAVRIGLDDLAARFIGRATRLTLPKRGQWIRQGQKVWSLERDGRTIEMVSPIEGMITDVNEMAAADPQLPLRDPYGEGWLLAVHSPDARTNFRNLLSGAVARKWLEEAAARLRGAVPALTGAYAQDGGLMVDDLGEHVPQKEWNDLAHEFFLS